MRMCCWPSRTSNAAFEVALENTVVHPRQQQEEAQPETLKTEVEPENKHLLDNPANGEVEVKVEKAEKDIVKVDQESQQQRKVQSTDV